MPLAHAAAALSLLALPMAVHAKDKAAEAQVDKDSPEAVKCRRLDVTGSLAKKVRVCKTNAEWRAIQEQQNRDADDLVTRNRQGQTLSG